MNQFATGCFVIHSQWIFMLVLRMDRPDDATRNKCGSERHGIGKVESQRADEEVRRN
ncbi:hypothetical protein NDK50_09300 [Paraburkholderia bryophila]|uniref:hypothetical protein n=1 Tax=Paraburkholderia bryophila TaxID=420952 RepID=UPI00234B5B32|nr:hypothetical protein [Paraburkholderia bryophila]WCM21621.1 hypothetical protein NDK50_09300 [Paraburkholderia bryophila]